jgi:hypothetical protein
VAAARAAGRGCLVYGSLEALRRGVAEGESAIKCPPPLNVLEDTYDRSCCWARSDGYQHLMAVSPGATCRPAATEPMLHALAARMWEPGLGRGVLA